MLLVVTPCVVSQAQDARSPDAQFQEASAFDANGPFGSSTTDGEATALRQPASTLQEPGNNLQQPADSGQLAPGLQRGPVDPTAPPRALLDRIPKPDPVPLPQPLPAAKSTPTRRPVAKHPTIVPLPALPKVSLRGIVLSTPDRGTAMLNVNETSINVTLLPREAQHRISIPDDQFSSMKAALEQRAAMKKAASDQENSSSAPKQFEMCLQCSFAVDEVIFNVEAFTRDTVLLRAIPHDSLIIVRK